MGSFLHLLTKNRQKCCFYTKYLVIYTSKMFFEEYMNFKIFVYLRQCGVITVQSFRSHIGLTCAAQKERVVKNLCYFLSQKIASN